MSKVAYIRPAHVILPCFTKNLRTTYSKQGLITSKKFGPIFQSAYNKKYLGAWNHFSYISTRKLNLFDRLTFNNRSFGFQKKTNKESKFTLKRSPFVVIHLNMQKPMIQPWAFRTHG